ncbi:cathelicidin-3, partial [Vigna radiata var. radiata]|uniref:Cathelicidin-3 n=1 Tax=Vigna radiata var. radiata TaxID=3916 RepID=A0A1S3UUW6_VIGRR
MRKGSILHSALLCFWVPLLLLVTFTYATSAFATTQISGNEVNENGIVVNEDLEKVNAEGHDDEESKFKGLFPKPIPFAKPIPKPLPLIKPKPIPIPFYKKPTPKPIPSEEAKFKGIFPKPIPKVKPIPKIIPVVKPVPILKPVPKPFVKPIP